MIRLLLFGGPLDGDEVLVRVTGALPEALDFDGHRYRLGRPFTLKKRPGFRYARCDYVSA
jgi:hypothetical protein